MVMLLSGVGSLLVWMVIVMGVPLANYLKQDARWMQGDRSIRSWYE